MSLVQISWPFAIAQLGYALFFLLFSRNFKNVIQPARLLMELNLKCAGAGLYGVNLSLYGSGYGGRN